MSDINNRRIGFAALALTLALAAPAASEDYRMSQSTDVGWARSTPVVRCTDLGGFTHRASHSVTWYLNSSGQGAGKEAAVQGALAAWTNVSTQDYFVLSFGGTRSNGFQQNDGLNVISWGTNSVCDSFSCHAITGLLLEPGQVIKEADILFNASSTTAFQWMTNGEYSDKCWEVRDPGTGQIKTGLKIDTQGIATHELGHSLGIHHPRNFTTTAATMGQVACTPNGRSLEADDIEALRCSENRYPQNPFYEGAVDRMTCAAVSGWARNANQPHQTSYVELVEKLSTGFLKVLAVIPADGANDGFFYDPTYRDAKWHKIRVRYSGTYANVAPETDLICDVPLFPSNMRPNDSPLSTGGVSYEVGTQFSSTHAGYVTELGYYFPEGEGDAGTHTAHLWDEANPGTPLASIPLPASGNVGWSYQPLSQPVPIQAGVRYRVSINTIAYQSKSSCGTSNSFSTPYTTGPLTAHQGFWRQGSGVYPTNSSCSNFFVSVRFDV